MRGAERWVVAGCDTRLSGEEADPPLPVQSLRAVTVSVLEVVTRCSFYPSEFVIITNYQVDQTPV